MEQSCASDLRMAWLLKVAPRGLLGRLAGYLGQKPDWEADQVDVFEIDSDAGDPFRLTLLKAAGSRQAVSPSAKATLALVSKQRCEMRLSFPRVLKDEHGNHWDFLLHGGWCIGDSRAFLERVARTYISLEMPLTRTQVQSWLATTVHPLILDVLRGQSIKSLRDEHALPPPSWAEHFNEWLGPSGLAVTIADAQLDSEDAARAEGERSRIEKDARDAQLREQARSEEVRRAESEAKHRQELARIEVDGQLSAKEKEHASEMAERRHAQEKLEADLRLKELGHKLRLADVQYEAAVAKVARDAKAAQEAEAQGQEAERQNSKLTEFLSKASEALKKLAAMQEPVLRRLEQAGTVSAHQEAEMLTSPVHGVSAEGLALLGYPVAAQCLTQSIQEQSKENGVVLEKTELLTRDICGVAVKGLRIGTPLGFTFRTPRAGHVTLLNHGTSGAVWVQIPNAFVGPAQALARPGEVYHVPGSKLLPKEPRPGYDLAYFEGGPPGWEHIAVIVSDQPLIEATVAARSSLDLPFVRLTDAEVEGLLGRLRSLDRKTWAAGGLSFYVVDR